MSSDRLNTNWTLWQHSHDSTNWTINGYKKVATFSTVTDFWKIYNVLPSVTFDMWFLMRGTTERINDRPAIQEIIPMWEDERNKQGGSFKFKIYNSDVDNTWLILSLYLISESLCKPQDMQYISGISCSPKKNDYSTIAVWNTDSTRNDYSSFPSNIPNIVFTKSIYEPHIKRKIIGKGKYIAEKPVALSTTL